MKNDTMPVIKWGKIIDISKTEFADAFGVDRQSEATISFYVNDEKREVVIYALREKAIGGYAGKLCYDGDDRWGCQIKCDMIFFKNIYAPSRHKLKRAVYDFIMAEWEKGNHPLNQEYDGKYCTETDLLLADMSDKERDEYIRKHKHEWVY